MAGPRRVLVLENPEGRGSLASALARDGTFAPLHAKEVGPVEQIRGGLDAVVIDLDSTGDAETIVRGLAGRAPDIAIIVVASAADERMVRCLREGAHDYVLRAGDLTTSVQRACERLAVARVTQQRDKRAALAALLGNVAHELNNPLGILLGQADLLAETAEEGPLKDRARKVMHTTERCARMIKDFLVVARRQPLDRQKMDVARLLREAVETQAFALRADGIAIDLRVDDPLPLVIADRVQLQQALVNVITNAHHAMLETSAPRTLTGRATADHATGRLLISISDTGVGIPEALHARIFEPFFSATPTKRGPGLGLTVVQSIVEAHGGTIEVASRQDEGATFTIALPITVEPDLLEGLPLLRRGARAFAAAVDAVADVAGPVSGASILLVEDKPEVAIMLTDMLSIDGHHVETAADGLRALVKLGEGAYDVVVTDVRMPGLDGPGLYQELQRRHPRLRRRVIFCTGEALSLDTQTMIDRLQAPVISKPFAVEDLRRALRRVLAL